MSKRQKFVLVSLLLTLGLVGIQSIPIDQRYLAIVLFSGISVLFTIWALVSDLSGIEWLTILILPALYPASVGLFYFLLPTHAISRILLLVLFGVGMYALLLTENIYAVAAMRTIQLVRAAHAVGFLLSVTTSVFLIGTLFGLKFSWEVNGLVAFMILFPLLLQGMWSVVLDRTISKEIWMYSIILSLIGGELALVASFLPMIPLVAAILVSGYFYVVLGLFQQQLQERLFARTVQEYLTVGLMVLAAALFVTYR